MLRYHVGDLFYCHDTLYRVVGTLQYVKGENDCHYVVKEVGAFCRWLRQKLGMKLPDKNMQYGQDYSMPYEEYQEYAKRQDLAKLAELQAKYGKDEPSRDRDNA